MCVGHYSEITKCGQSAINRSPMNSGRRCLGTGNDLVGGQMLIGAIEYLHDGLTGSGHPLVLVAEQSQRRLDAGRRT